MPIIVLEGIDGSGKTTFAKRLAEEWQGEAEIVHKGPPAPGRSWREEYIDDLPLVLHPKHLIICDRWHVGEKVYGPFYRSSSLFSDRSNFRRCDLLLRRMGVYTIVLTTPLATVKERLAARGEDFLQEEHIDHVYRHYIELVKKMPYDYLNYSMDSWEPRRVITAARRRSREARTM